MHLKPVEKVLRTCSRGWHYLGRQINLLVCSVLYWQHNPATHFPCFASILCLREHPDRSHGVARGPSSYQDFLVLFVVTVAASLGCYNKIL